MLSKGKNVSSTADTRTVVGTLVGKGAIFDGNLTAPESVRIDGTVNGNCTCDKEMILGPESHIIGNISAQNIIISGKVEGDITAHGKLELLSTGRITGNITARSLVIDEDAFFDGRCTMTAAPESTSHKGTPSESSSEEKSKKNR